MCRRPSWRPVIVTACADWIFKVASYVPAVLLPHLLNPVPTSHASLRALPSHLFLSASPRHDRLSTRS